jgi:hypothetical protein
VAQQPGPQQDSAHYGCGLAILIAVILGATSLCSKETNQTVAGTGTADNAVGLMGNSASEAPPPPPQPFSKSAAKVGVRHFRLAYRLEGATGAMIYSRNCYDALDRHFSWAKLDICGAFDMAAGGIVTGDDGESSDEASYFDTEASAGRYLASAIKGGGQPSEADERLALLQRTTPRPKPTEQTATASTDLSTDPALVPAPERNTLTPVDLENVD